MANINLLAARKSGVRLWTGDVHIENKSEMEIDDSDVTEFNCNNEWSLPGDSDTEIISDVELEDDEIIPERGDSIEPSPAPSPPPFIYDLT